MNYFKQVWYEMRQQPLVTWVNIAGTAISIFLIMALVMIEKVDTVDAAPEVNRSRTLVGAYIHMRSTGIDGNECSGSLSLETAHRLYDNLDGVEVYSFGKGYNDNRDVNMQGGPINSLEVKSIDENFWKIYSFDFLKGQPFTAAQVKAGEKRAIVTDRVAFLLAGNADIMGKEILINHLPYVVSGVVKTGSPLLKQSFADIYIPYVENPQDTWKTYLGQTSATLLLKEGVSPEDIKKEVERRYEVWNDRLRKEESREFVYHRLPYTAEEMTSQTGSNQDPDDVDKGKWTKWITYGILLLVPALNLSGMTRSRLRRRVSEIGVRRAYGATRLRIVGELLTENFLLTLAGGLIGLILSVVFIMCFSHLFVDFLGWNDASGGKGSSTPAFNMFFTWGAFLTVLLLCFILNILSTGIPAWKASRVNPAEAITTRR